MLPLLTHFVTGIQKLDYPTSGIFPSPHRSEDQRGPWKTGLLVSVSSAAEAQLAASSKVHLIDIKQPRNGALGAATPETWMEIMEVLPADTVISIALGEAPQADTGARIPSGVRFVKVGPAGCTGVAMLRHHWQRVRAELPQGTELVAVAYADYAQADCCAPEEILSAAAADGLGWWLLDTFCKDGRSSLEHLGLERLDQLNSVSNQLGMRWVLSGSLRLTAMPTTWQRSPSLFGLRGDVCQGGRQGALCRERITWWLRYLQTL